MSTEEGNKLIDAYLGIIPSCVIRHNNEWDSLMLAVEKIRKDFDLSIQFMGGDCNVYVSRQTLHNDELFSIGGYSDAREAVFDAVVRFIKWYNNQTPNP